MAYTASDKNGNYRPRFRLFTAVGRGIDNFLTEQEPIPTDAGKGNINDQWETESTQRRGIGQDRYISEMSPQSVVANEILTIENQAVEGSSPSIIQPSVTSDIHPQKEIPTELGKQEINWKPEDGSLPGQSHEEKFVEINVSVDSEKQVESSFNGSLEKPSPRLSSESNRKRTLTAQEEIPRFVKNNSSSNNKKRLSVKPLFEIQQDSTNQQETIISNWDRELLGKSSMKIATFETDNLRGTYDQTANSVVPFSAKQNSDIPVDKKILNEQIDKKAMINPEINGIVLVNKTSIDKYDNYEDDSRKETPTLDLYRNEFDEYRKKIDKEITRNAESVHAKQHSSPENHKVKIGTISLKIQKKAGEELSADMPKQPQYADHSVTEGWEWSCLYGK